MSIIGRITLIAVGVRFHWFIGSERNDICTITGKTIHRMAFRHFAELVCHSKDGINWYDHRLILSPRREVTNEDIAVAAPFVWRDPDGYRMIYSAIGTRWPAYSMSQAYSRDGYEWERGHDNENLVMSPAEDGSWESQMVEYANIVPDGKEIRLYYCGNDYGATGIGTAVSDMGI